MTVIVDDTNILIDLANTGLITQCQKLDIHFVTTDLAFAELRNARQLEAVQSFIDTGGLEVTDIKNADLMDLLVLYHHYATFTNLSLPDVSVLWLAEHRQCRLLTSDQKLLNQARERGIEASGLLWLTDAMVEQRVVPPSEMIDYLLKLLETNERAPRKLILERIDNYIKVKRLL